MNEETIEKIISKHKLYMSMDGYEYEAITKVDLYKLIEEIERLNKNKKETLDFIERYLSLDLDNFNASSLLRKIREILDREEK